MNIEKINRFVWSDVKNMGTKDGIDTTFLRAIFPPKRPFSTSRLVVLLFGIFFFTEVKETVHENQ